ncbi:MAG: PilT/PilU family type 4a pilus ATPase [Candidatus Delongbacteria bacterium]|nr:PilT/PilU family type 4a pilus ATPase [Candidatus Delongbacteria bacterium]MCG2760954.1 PilT/PilU family type 4a pilus ATPase [Candidatus Delongbacteria bacterium]
MFDLQKMFASLLELSGSDIHLKVGIKPIFRINGELIDWGDETISMDDMNEIADGLMGKKEKDTFTAQKEVDFGFGVKGVGRFRVNIYKQRGTVAIAIRAIPFDIKGIDQLHLPEVLKKLCMTPRGMIIVTGTVGSGKSTTIAAMLEHINQTKRTNIITIEDPIEFLFRDKKSVIHQREVGSDTDSYQGSLRYLLRQDPDIIMIGEIRDPDSMYTAIRAANTGHLVFTTLHTTDALQTISRILSFFPGDLQNEIRNLLAVTLTGIISQRLIPTRDGKGRVPATEVLINNEMIKEAIIDPTKTSDIKMSIEKGEIIYGMHNFDQSIYRLYGKGLISYDEAIKGASTPTDFERRLKGLDSSDSNNFELGDYKMN